MSKQFRKMVYFKLCTIFILNIIMYVESIEVRTTFGRVRGKLVDDPITGAYFYSFEGIPYAEPPMKNLRFKPPVPKRPWHNVFDATKPGRVCPQVELIHSKKEMSEDCLNFNIYMPANNFNKLLPVIFNIHGGDFNFLSGKAEPIYGSQLLVREGIVVVTMNYRLGALGFLSLCTEAISGNAGLKDVLLVLKIVYENIKRFGGDPNNITIMGNGAGAAMAQYLMLIDESKGLFQKVILHSGSVLSTEFIQLDPRKNAMLLAQKLNLDMSNDDCMMDELRQVDVFDIIRAQNAINRNDPQRGFRIYRPFKPTVEIECANAVLTKAPLEMIRAGAIRDVPMLIGFNNQEGIEILRLLRKEPQHINKLNQNIELLIPSDLKYPHGSAARRNLAIKIKQFYFNGGDICFDTVQNYINLMTDTQYSFSIDYFIKLFKEKMKAPVYYYILKADTELNWFKAITNITYPGAAHFDGIGYVFLTSVTKPRYQCLDSTTKYIQNTILLKIKYFLDCGSPAPNPNTKHWPEAGKERFHVVQDCESTPVYHCPFPERIAFWQSVYEEYFSSCEHNATYFCTNDNIGSIL